MEFTLLDVSDKDISVYCSRPFVSPMNLEHVLLLLEGQLGCAK
jgi:hypothetical protein